MTNVKMKNIRTIVGPAETAWNVPIHVNRPKLRHPLPAQSVRVPVTRQNREYLRSLRAAELQAWEAAPQSRMQTTQA